MTIRIWHNNSLIITDENTGHTVIFTSSNMSDAIFMETRRLPGTDDGETHIRIVAQDLGKILEWLGAVIGGKLNV
jgi:hypothetical protein